VLQRKNLLKSLLNYGLIRFETKTKTYSMHRFLQFVIRENRSDFVEEDLRETLSVLTQNARTYRSLESSPWDQGESWYLHASELMKWISNYRDLLKEKADTKKVGLLHEGIGNWCVTHDQYSAALDAYKQALALYKKIDNIPKIGIAHHNAGWALLRMGKYPHALRHCEKAETIQRHLQQENILDYAVTLTTKGRIFEQQGKYPEALAYHTKSLKLRLENLPEMSAEIGISYNGKARCLHRIGDYQESLSLFDKTSQIYEAACGPKNPLYSQALINKSWVLLDLEQYSEALKLFKRCQSLLSSTPHVSQGDFAYVWNGIGWCHLYLNDYHASKKAFRKSLKLGLLYHGKNTSIVVRTYNGLGWCYLKHQEFDKGFKYLQTQLQLAARMYDKTPKLLGILENYEKALKEIEQIPEKKELFQQASELAHQVQSENIYSEHK
jgi:tetratricopeptide (TPR) repeat protein